MSTPTKEEKAWIKKVEKLLLNPPSERLGLYTIGDCCLTVYDKAFDEKIERLQNLNQDFCQAVNNLDAELGCINSATEIHSTAG